MSILLSLLSASRFLDCSSSGARGEFVCTCRRFRHGVAGQRPHLAASRRFAGREYAGSESGTPPQPWECPLPGVEAVPFGFSKWVGAVVHQVCSRPKAALDAFVASVGFRLTAVIRLRNSERRLPPQAVINDLQGRLTGSLRNLTSLTSSLSPSHHAP